MRNASSTVRTRQRRSSGTGLGLAIARRLARVDGGDVRLDSKSTPGARFSLVLPEA
jgi:signal transduction histidine kinase